VPLEGIESHLREESSGRKSGFERTNSFEVSSTVASHNLPEMEFQKGRKDIMKTIHVIGFLGSYISGILLSFIMQATVELLRPTTTHCAIYSMKYLVGPFSFLKWL